MPEILKSILMLLAGCGVFMTGMRLMSEGLERSAGKGLRKLFGKISDKRVAGYGIGAGITCVIQSSSATSVMTIGFVNAGIMTLFQASAIILGAKLGTTITGILVSLTSFKLDAIFCFTTIVGIFMTFFARKDFVKNIGTTLTGFGLIFVGLMVMSSVFQAEDIATRFIFIFEKISFPLLLILIGLAFTAIIQSSSASTGIFIMLVGNGVITFQQAIFLTIGANIGTCVTAVLACIGTSTDAKRVALLHVMGSVIGTLTVGMLVFAFRSQVTAVFARTGLSAEWQLSIFNVLYNLSYTLLILPFLKPFTKLSTYIIRDKKKGKKDFHLYFLDDRILQTPQIAVAQVEKEVLNYADIVKKNLVRALDDLIHETISDKQTILHEEQRINYLERNIIHYLIKLSAINLDERDELFIATLHHVVSDLERIGDHAENFFEMAEEMLEGDLKFSEEATAELQEMIEKIFIMYDECIRVFKEKDIQMLRYISELEEEIDKLKLSNGINHIRRLNDNVCSVESGTYYYEVITELERIADHLNNIAYSVRSPIGSKYEAFKSIELDRKREHISP